MTGDLIDTVVRELAWAQREERQPRRPAGGVPRRRWRRWCFQARSGRGWMGRAVADEAYRLQRGYRPFRPGRRSRRGKGPSRRLTYNRAA